MLRASSEVGVDVSIGPGAWCSTAETPTPSIILGSHSYIDCILITRGNGRIVIGEHSWVGGGGSTRIGALIRVEIGRCAIISNHVHIYDSNHHPTDPSARLRMSEGGFFNDAWEWTHSDASPVVIGDNVWIGEYAAILKGVHIGRGSIVAAHAVVVHDIPDNCVAAGNPAKVVKHLAEESRGPI